MPRAACAAKCEVNSRLPDCWKESSVGSADWRIPAGPRILAPMTREPWLRGSSSEQSHFPTSSSGSLCSAEYQRSSDALSPLMAIAHAAFLWGAAGFSDTSCTAETDPPLCWPTCLLDGSDVEPITAKIRLPLQVQLSDNDGWCFLAKLILAFLKKKKISLDLRKVKRKNVLALSKKNHIMNA